jgi:hypothetical protein
MPRRATDTLSPLAASDGRRSAALARRSGAAAVGSGCGFFYGEAEAAADLGLSPGGLALARSRGEVDSLFETIGRRVIYSRAIVLMRALGLRTPEDLGRFCKGAGIRDLAGLLAFLGADEGGAP